MSIYDDADRNVIEMRIAPILEFNDEVAYQSKINIIKMMRSIITDKAVLDEITKGTEVRQQEESETKKSTESAEKKERDNASKLLGKASSLAEGAADTTIGIAKTALGLLESIYGKMKSASPLLQSVEQLFNLAMTLFFMPLGNKLALVMIPAVIDLVEKVTDMWDAFDGMSLEEMFSYAISQGVDMFGSYFADIGSQLSDQGGTIGAIGQLLEAFGNFVKSDLINVLNIGVGLLTTLISNYKGIIFAIGEFMTLHYALMLAQISVTASQTPWSSVAGAAAVGTLIAGTSASLYAAAAMGDGGYVDPVSGGTAVVLAERGEREYVVPESKKESFARQYGNQPINITLNVQGYTDENFSEKVLMELNNASNQYRLRSMF